MSYKSKRNQATFVSYQLAKKFLNQKETLGYLGNINNYHRRTNWVVTYWN